MRIRIATKAWKDSNVARRNETPNASVGVPWVELDGTRYDHVLDTRVEMSGGVATVTITFAAAVEMVLLNGDGSIP